MEIQIDVKNIMGIRDGTCIYEKLMVDMRKVACMVVKKYRYPYSMVEDVISESVVFLLSHVDRIPKKPPHVNSYVLALSRSLFRKALFCYKDSVSQDEAEYRLNVVAAVYREVGDVSGFQEVVAKVFRSYCFYSSLGLCELDMTTEQIPVLVNHPSFRRLFLNVHNRLRYDKVDNCEESIKDNKLTRFRGLK